MGDNDVGHKPYLFLDILVATLEGWTNRQPLVDPGAQVNLISQLLVKESGWTPSEDAHVSVAGWKGHEFTTYEVYELMLCMTNSNGCERKTTEQFIALDIDGCEPFLRLPLVQRSNQTIEWRHNTWRHGTKPRVEEIPLSALADAAQSQDLAFVAFVRTAHVTLPPGPQILTVRVHKVANAYWEFKNVFSNTLF